MMATLGQLVMAQALGETPHHQDSDRAMEDRIAALVQEEGAMAQDGVLVGEWVEVDFGLELQQVECWATYLGAEESKL